MRYAMGTLLRVQVESADAAAARARDELFAEIQRLETLLSVYRSDSDISRINGAAGVAAVRVDPDTYAAVDQALRFAELTSGAFDPTLRGDFPRVRLDPAERSVFLPADGMRLDLGGIGKGFALDQALARASKPPSIEKIIMNFGGQLLFWAPAGAFEPLKVAIENPRKQGEPLAVFEVRTNCSVSTSSQAERPGHLLDPRSGRPASKVESATVIAPSAAEAEAWSTALFVAPDLAAALKQRTDMRTFIHTTARKRLALDGKRC